MNGEQYERALGEWGRIVGEVSEQL